MKRKKDLITFILLRKRDGTIVGGAQPPNRTVACGGRKRKGPRERGKGHHAEAGTVL